MFLSDVISSSESVQPIRQQVCCNQHVICNTKVAKTDRKSFEWKSYGGNQLELLYFLKIWTTTQSDFICFKLHQPKCILFFWFSLKPLYHLKRSHLVGSMLFLCPSNTTHTTFFKSQRLLTLHYNRSATSNMLKRKKEADSPREGKKRICPVGSLLLFHLGRQEISKYLWQERKRFQVPPAVSSLIQYDYWVGPNCP